MTVAVGQNRGDKAVAKAVGDAEKFYKVGKKPYDAIAAALAWRLCAANAGGWFAFGDELIAGAVGRHYQTAGRIVKRLVAAGLIEVKKDENGKTVSSYTRGESREIRWIGDWWFKKPL